MYTLDDICTLITDGSHFSPEDEGTGYPMLSVKDMGEDDFDFSACKYVGEESFQKLLANGCMPLVNDVVVAKDGSYLKSAFPIKEERKIALLSSIAILRPDLTKVNPAYLSFFLKSDSVYRTVSLNYISGTALKRIILKGIKQIPVALPTMDEQLYRVALLESLSKIIRLRRRALQRLDDLIKARFVEMFGEPIANPLAWPVKRLKEMSVLITNGNTPKGGSENYVDHGIVFLRSQNVWRNRIELDDVAYIDNATHMSMKKSSLHYKDILITKTGRINTENSSLGRAALFLGKDDSANINGHVYLVRLDGSIVPEFVVTILTGEAYRRYIRKVCVGGIDKRQINVDQVEDFPIIVPPINMQKEFAEFKAQVDKSKFEVQKSLDETRKLFYSLMQEYFGR